MKKLIVICLGFVFAIILLEIALRMLGLFQEGEDKLDIKKQLSGTGYSVLCLGDSFTRGVGAPAGDDYPSQLQNIISANGLEAKVVNRGIPGKNSTQILNTLKSDLLTYKPDLIILLTGGANNWNYYGYGSSPAGSTINNFFYRIRVFKLVSLIIKNLGDKGQTVEAGKESHLDQEKFDSLMKEFESATKEEPAGGDAYYKIGDFFMYEQNVEKAIEWFGKGIEADPLYTDNYLNLAMAYHASGREEEANETISRALSNQLMPGKDKLYSYMSTYYLQNERYSDIIDIVHEAMESNSISRDLYEVLNEITGNRETGQEFSRSHNISDTLRIQALYLLDSFPPENSLKYTDMPARLYQAPARIDLMLSADRRLISNWIRDDIRMIIDMCMANGIEIVIQNYPIRGTKWTHLSKSYKLANDAIAGIAFENNIPLVDNQAAFTALGEKQKDYLEAPGGGEHCNSKGYRFIAENVFSVISKEKLLVSE